METNVLSYLRKTKITGVLIGAMALTAAVGCADLENVDPALIDGVVQNVDAVSGEVTLELPDGTTTTINLNDVDLGALNADSGSAVLSEGDEVGLTLGQDDSVTSITPTIVKSEGTIQMINADLLIVQITTENGIDISVNVDEQSRITARGKGPSSSSFDELTVGIEVDVEYNPETMDASRIHFHRNDLDRDDDELIGTISGVNVDSHTVTILGADNQELTLTITPATKIDQNGPATFAAIEAGAVADIEFDIEDESHVDASDSTDSPDVDEPDHADDHDVDEVDEPDHADDHDVDEIDEPDHADDHDVDDVDEPDHADDHDVDDVDEPDHADTDDEEDEDDDSTSNSGSNSGSN